MRTIAALSTLALLLAACEVNVQTSRGANAPPPPPANNGNGGVVYQNGSSAPPAYGNGTTAPPAYGNGTTAPPAYGNGTTAPPAYGNGTTAPPANGTGRYVPPATTATPTPTTTPSNPPPATTVGNVGVVVVGPNSGVGTPFGPGGVSATGRMGTVIRIVPAAPPKGPGSNPGDMATPLGRLPLVSGDIDFGSNIQYSDSFRGMIYLLPPGTTSMPNFDAMKPQLALYTRTFEVEPQDFKGLGAPGASLRTQDFGIRYEGFFNAKKAGQYTFTLANEDGARVYIDNKLVVDNDGVHVVTWKAGNADLSAGMHLLRVEYFKAATNREVSLQIWVKTPDMANLGTVGMLGPDQ